MVYPLSALASCHLLDNSERWAKVFIHVFREKGEENMC